MFNWHNNFFYFTVKYLARGRNCRLYKLAYSNEIALLLLSLLRVFNLILSFHSICSNQWKWEPLARFIRLTKATHQYDQYFFMCLLSIEVGNLFVHFWLHFHPCSQLQAEIHHALVVDGTDKYRKSLLSACKVTVLRQRRTKMLKKKIDKMGPFKVAKRIPGYERLVDAFVNASIFVKLDNVNKTKMFRKKIKMFPTLSSKLRVRLMIIVNVANYIFELCSYLVVFPTVIYLTHVPQLVDSLPWRNCIPVVYDYFFLLMSYWVMYRDIFYLYHFTTLSSETLRIHISEGNEMLAKLVKKNVNPTVRLSTWDLCKVRYFMQQHTKFAVLTQKLNRSFASRVILTLVLTHFPVNLVFNFRLAYYSLNFWDQTSHILLSVYQMIGVGFTLLPMARFEAAFRKTHKYLPQVIAMLKADQLQLKLKLEVWYSRLTEGQTAIGTSIGPGKTVTFALILELFLACSALELDIYQFFNGTEF